MYLQKVVLEPKLQIQNIHINSRNLSSIKYTELLLTFL